MAQSWHFWFQLKQSPPKSRFCETSSSWVLINHYAAPINDHSVLIYHYLVLTSDYLVVTIDCLVVTSDYLVLINQYLVETSDNVVVTHRGRPSLLRRLESSNN